MAVADKFIGYPNPLASESEKAQDEYGLRYFKSLYRDWTGENEVLLQSRRTRWQSVRDYAGGKQSIQIYKDLLNVEGDESFVNLDWKIVPIIPKFVDIIVNSLTNADYAVHASAIDPVAIDKRKSDELRMKTKMMMRELDEDLQELTGLPMTNPDDFAPGTAEELELYMQLTYKQAVELAIEQGLQLALSINEWKEVAKRVIRDLVVIGMGAVKTEVDHRGVIIRYVDPMYLVTSYSDDPDFQNISHAGEIRRITMSQLKAEAGDQFTTLDYEHIAKKFAGKYGNSKKFRVIPNIINGLEYYDYDNFLIDILDAQFIVPNELKHEKKGNRYGTHSVNFKREDYVPPKKSKYKREMLVTSYECKYVGKWIIDSQYIFDYKKATNQSRAKSSLHKTKLDYIIYSPDINFMRNQSLAERMIPFGDQIQLTHLKLQHLSAKARPKGMAMEVGSIENVPNGKGGVFSPLAVQDVFDQTGVYYYRQIMDDGSPSTARPITELDGGVGSALSELLALYDYNLNRLRDVTGVNEARDGNLPSKDSVVGVAKLNLIASNNATRAVNDAYLNILKRVAESSVIKIQDLVKYHKPYQGYVSAIGQTAMDAISITKDVSLHEFGIIIEAEPSEIDKERLEANIQQAIAKDSLRIEDAEMIRNIKNTKLANRLLVLRRNKYLEEQAQIAAQNAQANTEQNQIALQQKAEADIALDQAKHINANKALSEELAIRDQYEEKAHLRKLEQIEKLNEGKVDVAEVNDQQKS
jgi:hypothetical protein